MLAAQAWKWGGFCGFSEFVIAGDWNAKIAKREKSIRLSFIQSLTKYILLDKIPWYDIEAQNKYYLSMNNLVVFNFEQLPKFLSTDLYI